MKPRDDNSMEDWGHPVNPGENQLEFWDRLMEIWCRFYRVIPEPSLDIGAGRKKGRTVSLDPFPRGVVDLRGIAECLPFRDGVFKSVVLESVLKHVLDPRKALNEAKRVSREPSFLFLTSPVNVHDKHRHSFKSSELLDIIDQANYKVLRMRGIGFSSTRLDRAIKRISMRIYLLIRVPARFCRVLFLVCGSKQM